MDLSLFWLGMLAGAAGFSGVTVVLMGLVNRRSGPKF